MAQSYTRQSTFADGDTITASLFNNEYNQLENSFSYSSSNSSITGHRHDGTAGQGGNIFKIGDLDFLNKIEVDGTSNRWGVYVEVGGVSTEQIRVQDGSIVPVTNNDIDLGTPSLEFKDLFIDGTAHIDTLDIDENATVAGTLGVTGATTLSSTLAVTGTSTLTGNVTATNDLSIGGNLTVTGNATINGNLTFGDADTDSINLAAEIDSNIVPNTDNTYDLGTATKEWRNLYINGTANIDSLVADTADINGGTIDGATIATSDINGGTIDGVTIATSDITVGAAKTLDVSAGTLTLADDQISGDKVEGGTINATTINTLTYGSLSDGVITVTAFVDEDDMVSNSATLVPTQQSVKTYVDTLVAATNEVVEDATPQLGGDLDLNSNNITGTGNINITGTIQSSGNITGTLATAAQGNVTSLGTLTSLDVSGDLTVDTNTLKVDSTTNRVGILNVSPDVSLDIGSATDAVHVPVGTTAQRPGTPVAGYFRYNADLEQFEGYTDTWGAIGGGGTNTFTYDTYTGDGVTTNFVLSQATNLEGNLIVFIDGVFQTQDAYTISTVSGITTLIFSAAPANTRKIVVYTIAAGVSGNNLNLDSFSGDGVLTDFTLSINAISENNTQVYIDGVYQQKDGYTVTNTTLSFSAPPLNGSTIEVMTFTQTEVNVPVDNTITSAKLSGDLVTPGNLDVTGSVTALSAQDYQFTAAYNGTNSTSYGYYGIKNNNVGNPFYFHVGGQERMRIDSAGSVGIGTGSPSALLGLNSAAPDFTMLQSDAVKFRMGVSGGINGGVTGSASGDYFARTAGGKMLFSTDDGVTAHAVLDSSGNLGIGTNDVTDRLTINADAGDGITFDGISASAAAEQDVSEIKFINRRSSGTTIKANIKHITSGTANGSALTFGTTTGAGATEAMRIDSSGKVGLNVSTITDHLEINGGASYPHIRLRSSVNTSRYMRMGMTDATTSTIEANGTSTVINFKTAGAERMRIDSSGNVNIGATGTAGVIVLNRSSDGNGAGALSVVGDDFVLNTGFSSANMIFKNVTSESMRLDTNGNLLVGKTTSNLGVAGVELRAGTSFFTGQAASPMAINRESTDGQLIGFYNDEAPAGDISVSGTTVSYNAFMGSHYSETVDTGILFGTVMEVTGELVDQNYAIQERLSKVKVSDTAESKNVYGVWVGGYDGGGETVAALGASWCRIASGVTLELGDLLVSNGDGTAKVQSDDIIRSMTIGKVTSVTVKETHTDGSFVVPVVLYCG